ncbi:MAG: hypothetical protein Q9218_004583 [Villophora microphyllina]
MRLINTKTYELHDSEGLDSPEYAILSHKWVGVEVTFQMLDSANWRATNLHSPQMEKIRAACTKAREQKPTPLEWLWVDTCCIDKTNSVELASSINAMFDWYYRATVCFAYLYDVDWNAATKQISKSQDPKRPNQEAAWFERGWTLQELLAPQHMEFYDRRWVSMGTRDSLADILHAKTGIAKQYLTGASNFRHASVATRMSWMAGRTTAKVEDIAYAMLGLLRIHMEIHYGEGVKAFMRLQRTLMESSIDESIFAWTTPSQGLKCYHIHYPQTSQWAPKDWGLLAPSPDCFSKHNDLVVLTDKCVPRLSGGYRWAQQGVHFQMPVVPGTEVTNFFGVARSDVTLALNCWKQDTGGKPYNITIQLSKTGSAFSSGTTYKRVQCNDLGMKKWSKPKTNSVLGVDQVMTRPLTITQPEFDPYV